jgi:hypothetical protein
MHSNSNGRASLLSGLRTGGVRSASQPSIVPHTAAVGGSFNVPRHPYNHQQSHFPEEEADELADMLNYSMNFNGASGNHRMMPATAGPLDGAAGNRFQQQQQAAFLQQMAAQRSAMNGMGIPGMAGVDPMQMQLMQLELMKLQALQQAQQQQFQVELMAQQSQRQQMMQQQQRNPRRSSTYGEPATAGPGQTSFDLRGPNQFARDQGDAYGLDQGGPKTAALGGKFGGRPVLSALNPNATVFTLNPEEPSTPKTATPGNVGRTTVISGGTSLGGGASGAGSSGSSSGTGTPTVLTNVATTPAAPSKSDSAASWRRPSGMAGSGTPLTPTRTSAPSLSPLVRLPPGSDDSNTPSPLRQRPSPLRFNDPSNGAVYGEFEASGESDLDSYVSGGRRAASSSSVSDNERDSAPTTPPSAESVGSLTREEASKRLYEGLGVGRTIQIQVPTMHTPPKQVTQVIRQPRGPPASVDELGPRNFAARLQKRLVAQAA